MPEPDGFVVPSRIADEVARHLEWSIVYGDLRPMERLREEEFTGRYAVSRSPIRMAFEQLARDGLLVRLPRRGVTVAPMSDADLRELYGVRIALEGQAANEATRAATPDHVAAMQAALEAMRSASEAGDIRAFFRENLRLSEATYHATGNATLQRLLAIIEKQARRYRFAVFARRPHLVAASIEGNARFLDIVEAGDAEAAEALMRRLIERSRDELRAVLPEIVAEADD